MTGTPVAVVQAAVAFGLDAGLLRSLGGSSGSSWGVGEQVLRVGRRAVVDAELTASSAAAAVVPVPSILDRVELGDSSAVLLERLPGRPAAELARRQPELARPAGRACGAVHGLLAEVPAPAGLPAASAAPPDRSGTAPARVLHLDLHPLNVLVGDGGAVTGVLDWANAAAGDTVLDRARSWTILTLDPAALLRRADPGWVALTEAGSSLVAWMMSQPQPTRGLAGSCSLISPGTTLLTI